MRLLRAAVAPHEEREKTMTEDPKTIPCAQCEKPTQNGPHLNPPIYCSWECRVAACEARGGERRTPNGLPVRCIRFDGLMLECEGGAHRDYLFPVDIVSTEEGGEYPQLHALIYTDGNVAVTLWEHCYTMWSARYGEPIGGSYQRECERLSEASINAIAAHMEKRAP